MDRIGEQARLVLEQTEKDEDLDENYSSSDVKIKNNIDIDIDDDQDDEDLEAYKVRIEPNFDEINGIDSTHELLDKLCISEEMKDENEKREAINLL